MVGTETEPLPIQELSQAATECDGILVVLQIFINTAMKVTDVIDP
jgi:hypothetical protein